MRDGDSGPEVFLVKRTRKVAFMAGAHVYPGGRVDEADHHTPAKGGTAAKAAIGTPTAHGLAVAAVRELFEESGILLADGVIPADVRDAINDGTTGFAEACQAHGVQPDLDMIAPWAHWITPDAEPRRYDTWFFVAAVPNGTEARHDDGETVDSAWLRPADALQACRDGAIFLAPPTWTTLEELLPFATVAEVLEATRSRSILPIQPVLRSEAGQIIIVLPGDPENPANPGVEGPTRLHWTDAGWQKAWAPTVESP